MILAADAENTRRQSILEASAKVFARFGFRKASMEEVAQAAQISRQGLYLHFSSKEELFTQTIIFWITQSLLAMTRKLEDSSLTLQSRIIAGLESIDGQHIGLLGSNYPELFEAAQRHVGDKVFADYEQRLLSALTDCLKKSALQPYCKAHGVSLTQLAEVLLMCSSGLKLTCKTRPEFHRRLTNAVNAILRPWIHLSSQS